MKRKTFGWAAAAGAACIASVLGFSRMAQSADHLDSPAVVNEPTADINDMYAWMDGSNLVLAMTVLPAADKTSAKFSDSVQYVFHTSSGKKFGATTADEDIICTFDVAQKISCWVGTDEMVTGDASATTGLSSTDGKVKVFAGVRADPFFFNLDGFQATVKAVEGAAGSLTFDTAGCPTLNAGTSKALRDQLQHASDGGAPADFFANLNSLAIVVSVDKSLVTKGGSAVAAWAATYNKP